MAYQGPPALLSKFRDVTRGRIGALIAGLDALERNPGDEEGAAALLREIHTVKGESKMMGFEVMNLVAHHTEELLLAARAKGFALDDDERDDILYGFDLLNVLVQDDPTPNPELAESARAFLGRGAGHGAGATEPAAREASQEAPATTPDASRPVDASQEGEPVAEPREARAPGSERAKERAPDRAPERARDSGELDVIRLDAATLARLTSLSGELARRQQHTDRLLLELLRLGGEASRANAEERSAGTSPADGLSRAASPRGKVAALLKEMAAVVMRLQEEAFETSLQIGELQESVRRVRMYPVRSLLESYPPAIRSMARELDKRVDVVVDAGDVIVDKQVVDQLSEPLVHLIRNSVDHGIETPAEREANGKPRRATLTLGARQVSGAEVEISVRDDGRGIDPGRVRATAIARGVTSETEAHAMTDEQVLWLLFRPGFSTRQETSLLSGRGVGLDVVKKAIEGLGGSVDIESTLGQGTVFRLRVPVSVALTRALVVESALGLFAVPSPSVVLATRVTPAEIEAVGEGYAVRVEEESLRLLHLDELLGQPGGPLPPAMDVIVIGDGAQRVALRVGRLVGEQQLIRQGLDAFLRGVPYVNGTAVLEGGRHCYFLNQAALFRGATGGVRVEASGPRPRRRHRVLIVDDSEITRDMLVSVLRRLDCDVVEAVDGQDALERLAEGPVDLVLTDLDMPVLDGFGLIRALRARPDTSDLPVIVLSTRGSASDKTSAMGAGANAYIVKERFRQADLQELLRQHLPGAS